MFKLGCYFESVVLMSCAFVAVHPEVIHPDVSVMNKDREQINKLKLIFI